MHRPRLFGWSAYLLLPPLTTLLLAGLAAGVGRPRTFSELLAWLGGSYLNAGLLVALEQRPATRDPD